MAFHDSFVVAPLKHASCTYTLSRSAASAFHDSFVVAPLKQRSERYSRSPVDAFHDSFVVAPLKPAASSIFDF